MNAQTSALTRLLLLVFAATLSWSCSSGTTEPPTTEECARGDLGCSCLDGEVCSTDPSGAQLACTLGVCAAPPCEAGELGCACDSGSCGDGLECSSASGLERCEVAGCDIGTQDCGCALDRSCDDGLTCQGGSCQALSCDVGSLGCACSSRFTCESGLTCDLSTQQCRESGSCTPGNEGCGCLDDGSCVGELTCSSGQCVDPNCPAGLEGCACLDGACGETANGDTLSCSGGICQLDSCPAGDVGCACLNGSECADDATCVDGFCKADSCIPGTEGCDCLAGSCNGSLKCESGTVCVDRTGQKGGDCYDNGTCDRNLRCDDSIAPSVCIYCDLGSLGCQCNDDDTCSPGLACVEGFCVGDETVQDRTADPDATCYTPCTDNLVDSDGDSTYCDDGLVEGCTDGLECNMGSCVTAGSDPDMCFTDSDCPFFQICAAGYCNVECSTNSDCGSGEYCQQKVCRKACSLDSADCDSGYSCQSDDGQSGFCYRSASSTGQVQEADAGGFYMEETIVEFNNSFVSTSITLVNESDAEVTFTLRKVEHDVLFNGEINSENLEDYGDTSTCSGASCPLWWIEMGESGRITAERDVRIRAPGNCTSDCPRVTFRIANNGQAIDATRWRGVIEVQSDIGSDRIDLSYVTTPQGRWVGNVAYFANFEDRGIDTEGGVTGWLDRSNRDDVSGVGNGLIQRWGAFRTGTMGPCH